ncbi:hypothetical protein P9112_008239 [Eukaryota sp. TZLM1-RC]
MTSRASGGAPIPPVTPVNTPLLKGQCDRSPSTSRLPRTVSFSDQPTVAYYFKTDPSSQFYTDSLTKADHVPQFRRASTSSSILKCMVTQNELKCSYCSFM